MTRSRVFVAVAVFAAGCIAAPGIATLLVAPARAGAPQQRWEQKCVAIEDEASASTVVRHPYNHAVNLATGWNPVLAAYGKDGWELVTVVAQPGMPPVIGLACFKRAL